MQVNATLSSMRISPQKCRLIADQVRGMPVEKAINLLSFSPKKSAAIVKKLLMSAIANGLASNLIERAANVTLKEGRKLVLVPRETPLTAIHLENMLKLARAQACVLPAMPGFYLHPKTIEDQVNFVVAKILNYLQIPASCGLEPYWAAGDLVS